MHKVPILAPDEWTPLRFIDQPVEVWFDHPPLLSKKPGPPSGFYWVGQQHKVTQLISEWFDYSRRGRMAKNMGVAHLESASLRGSWGVGRFYFRVRTEADQVFDLYFDRAPEAAGDRAGHWALFREMTMGHVDDVDPSKDRL